MISYIPEIMTADQVVCVSFSELLALSVFGMVSMVSGVLGKLFGSR